MQYHPTPWLSNLGKRRSSPSSASPASSGQRCWRGCPHPLPCNWSGTTRVTWLPPSSRGSSACSPRARSASRASRSMSLVKYNAPGHRSNTPDRIVFETAQGPVDLGRNQQLFAVDHPEIASFFEADGPSSLTLSSIARGRELRTLRDRAGPRAVHVPRRPRPRVDGPFGLAGSASAVNGPHRRYNPLLDEWVLVLAAPAGAALAGAGRSPRPRTTRPAYDPACYLCPGNARAGGERNPRVHRRRSCSTTTSPRCCPGDGAPDPEHDDGLLRARARARDLPRAVLLAAPRPDARPHGRGRRSARVVDAWAEEVRALGARTGHRLRPGLREQGRADGLQQPAPALPGLGDRAACPTLRRAQARARSARTSSARRATCSATTWSRSAPRGERIVCENEHWVALVPFWAVWPFETMLLPRRRVADLPALRRRRARRAGRRAARGHRPLRQPVPAARSPTRWAGTAGRPTARRPSVLAAARDLLPAAAALGDGAQVHGRLRAGRRAAARPHAGGGGGAAARAARACTTSGRGTAP